MVTVAVAAADGMEEPSAELELELEAVLLVPPALLQRAHKALTHANCLVRRWHLGGRFGVPMRWPDGKGGPGERKAIPLIPSVAERIARYIQEVADGGQDQRDVDLPLEVQALLRSGLVEVQRLPAVPEYEPKLELHDNSVHSERAAETAALPTPAGGAFTFAELFAGVGGFRLGLEALGGRCVFASEIEASAVEVYRLNFGEEPVVSGDIWQVSDDAIPAHDLLVGGFPCQPFSGLGLQPGLADEKGQLFTQIVRILRARRPRAFLLENVPGLLQCDDGAALKSIVAALEESGYRVSFELVNARCLTAQCRRRLYFVGLRDDISCEGESDTFQFPFLPDLGLRAEDILDFDEKRSAPCGLAEAFTLNDEQFGRLRTMQAWASAGPNTLAWGSKICDTLVSHYGVGVSRGSSQLVPRPAPHNPRRFTPRECARLMGFPEEFQLCEFVPEQGVSFNAWCRLRYRLIGNAICPPVVAALAGAILAHCKDIPGYSLTPDWEASGRSAAVRLALGAIPTSRRDAKLAQQGHPSWRGMSRSS